jgi:hypothetical protein
MSDLDLQDDDVLRERLGRLASSAARSVPAAPAPEGIRRRGTARRNRRTAVGLVSAGLAVAAVAGVVSGSSILRTAPVQPARRPSVSVTSAPTPTGPPSPSPSVSTSTSSASTSSASGTSAPGSSSAATPGGRPSGSSSGPGTSAAALPWVADPWNKGYEFGFVWGARRSGDSVALTFDPAAMLLGAQAKAYYDAHPDEERFDYKILNDKSFTQTLRVPASATLYGNQVLGPRNGSQNQRITPDRLVARASGDSHHVAVWLKRSGPSQVVYLAEQYLP